jgi:hypothetical protein
MDNNYDDQDDNLHLFFLKEISDYSCVNLRDIIYVGIGTNPRVHKLDDFTPRIDQILPKFLNLTSPEYNYDDKTYRIIHFDKLIENNIIFLHEYFNSKNYEYDSSMNNNNIHIWRSSDHKVEVMINCYNFYYDKYKIFLEDLIEMTFKNPNKNSKMFLQDFSGNDSSNIFKQLYTESVDKILFKNRILFDVSYGENHCDIDLLKYEPIYDKNNNIINIMLMDINELRPYLNYHELINENILKYYSNQYRKITDIIPVDIRRKMLVEEKNQQHNLVSYKNLYTINSSYEDIVNVLSNEIMNIILILREIKFMTPEKEAIIHELLTNYKNYTFESKPSIYDWSIGFNKILI